VLIVPVDSYIAVWFAATAARYADAVDLTNCVTPARLTRF